jgi:hypothetical protein
LATKRKEGALNWRFSSFIAVFLHQEFYDEDVC